MTDKPRAIWSAMKLDKGQPTYEYLLQIEVDADQTQCPPEIKRLWKPFEVAICWSIKPSKAARRLSEETKRRMRDNRIRKRYPLIADELIEHEHAQVAEGVV